MEAVAQVNPRDFPGPATGVAVDARSIDAIVPPNLTAAQKREGQKAIPAIAKDPGLCREAEAAARDYLTEHRLFLGDCRSMDGVSDGTVHLVVTSPPYWSLKKYPGARGQLGDIADYEAFLSELDEVWKEALRVLVPGGRLVVVVGDVCLSRKRHGRHVVYPLHASIQEHCRALGFDNLAPIIWYKISNAKHETENGSGFLGKPYEPNAVVKNDVEYILFQRKPGGYRRPSLAARLLSVIPEGDHREWFQQIWNIPGSSTRNHPAPFSLELAERLVRMFSFAGDTVLDPFMGTATTNLAAQHWGRDSIGFEVEPRYFKMARNRLASLNSRVIIGE